MAISIGDALLKLGVDTSSFESDLKKSQSRVDQSFEKWGKRMALAGTVVVGSVAAIGGASIKMAMEAVESENLFEVSMGNMAQAARDWSLETSKALGLNEFELRKNIGTIYNMVSSMGLGEQAAYDMSTGITQLANDMASFYNLPTEEAFTKLRAGITGETEPLKRLGILVDEATVKTFAYETGIAKLGEELTNEQKVEARWQAILAQTANATGDLARTLDSPTNQIRLLKTQIVETSTKLGMALLPSFQKLLNFIKPIVDGISSWVGENANLAAVLLGLVGSGGALLIFVGLLPKMISMFGSVKEGAVVFKTALVGLKAATIGLNTSLIALTASTLGLAAGIGMIIFGITQLIKNSQARQRQAELEANQEKLNTRLAKERAKSLKGLENQYLHTLRQAKDMRFVLGEEAEAYLTANEGVETHSKLVTGLINIQGVASKATGVITDAIERLTHSREEDTEAIDEQNKALKEHLRLMGALEPAIEAVRGGIITPEVFFTLQEQMKKVQATLPSYQGWEGRVPGLEGQPYLATVHGGEYITQSPSPMSATQTANIVIMLDGRVIGKAVGQPLVDEIRVKTGVRI